MRKMKKAVAIQADIVVERIEDDYEQGEIGSQEYVADFVLTEPDIQSLIHTLASTLEVTRDDLRDGMWADDKTSEKFVFNWHRTEDEKTPNSEQTELWIKGKFKIYTYYYFISIKKIETQQIAFTAADLAKTIGNFDMN